ncbi:MAG: Hsp20 family protein [Rhodospirillaceae bacterium]|nr:Hsp20 family protein [Rhodospirillaceae bacterium]MBT6139106.1 Hsp20 family protein [Rhodospirillaceae bacterium]
MRTIDFSPIFRSTVGFDRMTNLVDTAMRTTSNTAAQTYPPYNIEKLDEDNYRITMAVAGFGEDDVDITVTDNTLVVTGKVSKDEGMPAPRYLHHGIAERAFERRFDLADFIKVQGAELVNGLLHVELAREVPEEKKPRKIIIAGGTPKLESKAA